ncbi:MAG: ABC transporter ATP-binding protein [Alphaproteobacteria bacterium]
MAYEGVDLFRDLDMTVPAGRWTCLLGPSGVGKSSLLRVIAGLAPKDARTSVDAADGQPLTARFSYMAQQDLLLPWLTARENVCLGALLRTGRIDAATRARGETLLAQVGLSDKTVVRPRQLSGGERQRVALARTLMEDRPIVLMDEPFSALDAITRHALQAQASNLLAGKTVLLVTHDPLEALRLGHDVLVLAGRPAQLGAPLHPDGVPPRDVSAPSVVRLHEELLRRLAAAYEAQP